jgi:hypothetical protein
VATHSNHKVIKGYTAKNFQKQTHKTLHSLMINGPKLRLKDTRWRVTIKLHWKLSWYLISELFSSFFVDFWTSCLRGWSSHFKAKNGVFNGKLSQKYKLLNKVLLLTNVFERKSCIYKKAKVTDGLSNQKGAYKTDGIIFSKCISSLTF